MSAQRTIAFKSFPYNKTHITLALESGVDTLIVPEKYRDATASLARCRVWTDTEVCVLALKEKTDEIKAVEKLKNGEKVVIKSGWEIIPIENLIAQSDCVAVEAGSLDEARVAAGVLEKGVATIVVLPSAIEELKTIVNELQFAEKAQELVEGEIVEVSTAGMGHRVCIDTMSLLQRGQGMLCGNSSSFTFLVHAETERNEYVAPRPFRVNAGAVHAYAKLPGDKTSYLGELKAGSKVMIVDFKGVATEAIVGRVKIEARPMLLIRARVGETEGAIFLQNAETIRLTQPNGTPVSVVTLKPGDHVLVQTDQAGRHFGMRIKEDIKEN